MTFKKNFLQIQTCAFFYNPLWVFDIQNGFFIFEKKIVSFLKV